MKIKTKILWTWLGMSLLVASMGGLAVNRQRAAAMVGAIKEAEDVARVVSFLLTSDSSKRSAAAVQEIIVKLHESQGRDVVLMDSNQIILADAVPSEIGTVFANDPGDEVGATIQDRKVRTFIEVSQAYPAGIKQIAVPVEGASGKVIGAVVLEYTPLYNEMMQLSTGTIRQIVAAGFGSIVIALLISVYMARLIATPLQQLTDVATGFAMGQTDLPMPPPRKDEIGKLTAAFQDMVHKRQRAEEELLKLRDELEVRVDERTAELAMANGALQAENADRKRAEESLRESEERFSGAFEHAPIGVALVSPAGRWLKVNHALCDLVGYTEAEMLTRTFQDITHPEDLDGDLENMRRLIAGEVCTYQMEKRYVHGRGHLVSALLNVSLVRDGQGQPRYFIAQIQDITSRKQTENALRASHEQFCQLADNITDAFWIRSPDMREVHYISPAFERIWGRPVVSLYTNPQQWSDFTLPEDRERVLAAFAALTGDVPRLDIEYRITRPAGEIRWVHARGFQVRNAANQLVRLSGIVTDITERKQAERTLLASQANMAAAQRIAHFGSWELELADSNGADASTLRWSDEMFRIAGYDPGAVEASNELFFHLVHPDDREPIRQSLATAIQEHREYSMVHRLIRADGGERIVHETAEIFFDEKTGRPLKIVGTCHDITERKLSESALEKAHQDLVKASHQAGMAEVATGVLHNVGNVLNSVNVASSCLADSLRKSKAVNLSKVVALLREHESDLGVFLTSDPKGRQLPAYLDQLAGHLVGEQSAAIKELEGLQKNIGHIKDIVSMQQRHAKISGASEKVRITDLVEDTLRMDTEFRSRHDVQVIREFVEVPPVVVEKQKVLQILVNLVRNARRACDDSGRSGKTLTLRIFNGDGRVKVAVCDNGVGIPLENLTRIFAHGFTTKKDGHGFGLHSSALAAKELGGELRVHSDGVGHGATFTLELPLEPSGGRS